MTTDTITAALPVCDGISYQLAIAGYFDASDYILTDYMRGYVAATLADALEAERAKVAAAYEAVANIARSHIYYDSAGSGFREDEFNDDIRDLTPTDAQTAINNLLSQARLEGWWSGLEAAAKVAENKCIKRSQYALAQSCRDAIHALPEPKEANRD